MSQATISSECPVCSNPIEIDKRWTSGGINDYGGYILQCTKCNEVFALHIGRDIMDSQVAFGARKIDQYDDELGNKEEILKKYGLT